MSTQVLERIEALAPLVGNTPLAAIDFSVRGRKRTIYAKLESMNLTGSVKDRMALHVLRRAYESASSGRVDASSRRPAATPGSRSRPSAARSAIPVTIFMPDWMSGERINLIRSLGADIELVSRRDGGFLGSISVPSRSAWHARLISAPPIQQ